MENVKSLAEFWHIKALLGTILSFFAPIQLWILVLILLILIDTGTGIAQALKYNRFSSNYLRKAISKIITYGLCIITARLLEQIFETTMISKIVFGFLSITEAISILENLTLLGIPIPSNLVRVILKNVKIFGLEDIVKRSMEVQQQEKEVEDIMELQIPTLKNEVMRNFLKIKFRAWLKGLKLIRISIIEENIITNDILYYKMMSAYEIIIKEMQYKWEEDGIPKECIGKFNEWHRSRVEIFLQNVKVICYSELSIRQKKQELLDRVVALLYQTILDAHRSEADLGACDAK